MTVRTILIYPDDVLRIKAEPVADPCAPDIAALIQDMADTMYDAPGVGLAAPQIGVSLRIAVTDTCWREEGAKPCLKVWINPAIISRSHATQTYEEGCLSVPDVYADVTRPAEISLRWLDEKGMQHEQVFQDFEAVALQHEFDHLDGILFVDHLSVMKRNMIQRKMTKRKKMLQDEKRV